MSKKTITSLLFMLLCASSAGAEVSGNVELGGTMLGTTGNRSKLNEYRDLGTGVTLGVGLDANKDDLYFQLSGENFRYNEETKLDNREVNFNAQAGQYGSHKLSIYYNQIPHNVSLGAKTFYTGGLGTNVLTGPVVNNNLATWNTTTFDYKRDRTNYGAGLELSLKSPFFFGVKFDRTDMQGLNPTGNRVRTTAVVGPPAVAAANFFSEFASPVDYKTENVSVETGYRSKAVIFKVDGLFSQFSNTFQTMTVPGMLNAATSLAPLTLPPNNDYYKVGGSLMVKLPLNSTLMARANHSILDNNIDLTQFLAGSPQYHGRVSYTTASLAVTSNPIKMLETRIFYNLLDKQNKSTDSFVYGGAATEKFAYHKQNVGVDLAVKLPASTKVSGGYEFQNLNRALRADAYSTTDHIVFVEAKNSALDMLTAKLRLQHLKRLSDDQLVPGAANDIDSRFRRYDATDKSQESIKAGVEIEPLHNLSIGLEYAFKLDSFDKTTIGVTSNRSHEFNLDANYTIANVKLNAYADYEFSRYKYTSRVGNFGVPVTDAIFDYNLKRENASYDYGINADVDIIKNILTANLGWRYAYSNGNESFATNRTITPLINIPADDDYTRQTLTAKLNYKVTKNLGVSTGYSYERLVYSEAELNNYKNIVLTGAGATSGYLSGAFANQGYEAHIGFVKLAYSF